MPPEVLAWALLFVIGFGLVYRFFAWVGGRFGRAAPLPEILPGAAAVFGEASAVSQTAEPPGAIAQAEPTQRAPVPEAPPPSLYAPLVVTAPKVPGPAPAVTYAAAKPSNDASGKPEPTAAAGAARPNGARAMPVGASAVMAARISSAKARTALAPSVAATLPPIRQSSDAAINPSQPAAPMDMPASSAELISAVPRAPDSDAQPGAGTGSADATPLPERGATDATPSQERPDRGAWQPLFLRAWRLGSETPSLDLRLRDARDRKAVPMPKRLRAATELHGVRELKVLVPRPASAKIPPRRILRKAGGETVLASSKAQTRIVGAPHRGSRVLATPAG